MIRTEIIEKNKEITHRLTIDSPRELVFRAWTDPSLLARWWGPKGFTNPRVEVDPHPGGMIQVDMQGPDGTMYPMGGVFQDVIDPELLVFTTTAFLDDDGEPQLEDLNTIMFEETASGTELTWHEVVTRSTPTVAGALEGMEEGSRQSLERLADLLEELVD